MALLSFTPEGIYCKQADVFVDPWKPVQKALITHGHSDHARPGHQKYLCTRSALPVIRQRLGSDIRAETLDYEEHTVINGVRISFHPAGHIVGSAQVRLEYRGEIWVVSGDYKTAPDPVAEDFTPVKCHHFITESTFGLPVYRWPEESEVAAEINQWWKRNQAEGKVSVIGAYALGKAQRVLKLLDPGIGKIFTHGAVENVNEIIREQGIDLPDTTLVQPEMKKKDFAGGLVIATPSAIGSNWMRKFVPYSTAFASGWMMLRGTRRRRSLDKGFILSDHADWEGLNSAIRETGAEHIYVTHGYTSIFANWLNEQGLNAKELETQFNGEEDQA